MWCLTSPGTLRNHLRLLRNTQFFDQVTTTDQDGQKCSQFSGNETTMTTQWADEATRFQGILQRELTGEIKAAEVLTKNEYRAAMERVLCTHLVPQGFRFKVGRLCSNGTRNESTERVDDWLM